MKNDLIENPKKPKKVKCPKCNGKGKIGTTICTKCKGTGFVNLLLD